MDAELLTMAFVFTAPFFLGWVSQLTAYDESGRERKTQVGALGGLLLGALSSLLSDGGEVLLPFVGFTGGASGSLVGWWAAYRVSKKALDDPAARAALWFLHKGPRAVVDYVGDSDRSRKDHSINAWSARYRFFVEQSCDAIRKAPPDVADGFTRTLLLMWMQALADTFNHLMLDISSPQEDRFHLRVSLIRFVPGHDGGTVGRHWLSYAGLAPAHNAQRTFGVDSVAHRVVSGLSSSPQRSPSTDPQGADRGDEPYRAFTVFRVDDEFVLTIDLGEDPNETQLRVIESVVESTLVPRMADLLGLGPRVGAGPGADPDATRVPEDPQEVTTTEPAAEPSSETI